MDPRDLEIAREALRRLEGSEPERVRSGARDAAPPALQAHHLRHLRRALAEIGEDLRRPGDRPARAGDLDALQPYSPGRTAASVRRELGLSSVVKLSSNEHALGAAPSVRAWLREHVDEIHRYPEVSTLELREALARRHDLEADQVFVGNGSNEAIDLLIRIFRPPGAAAVVPACSFSMYRHFLRVYGVGFEEVPLRGLKQDLSALAARARELRADLLILTSPHNPTGHTLHEAELRRLLAEVPEETLVVLDEAYAEYAEDDPAVLPGARLLPEHPRLVVLRTFSKAYGLAGMRVGYAMGGAEIIGWMDRVRQPFHLNRLALGAALLALRDTEYLHQGLDLNRRERSRVARALRDLGLEVPPSGSNFLFIGLGRPATPVFEGLLRRGVIARDLTSYGFPHALRLTLGIPAENDLFLSALRAVLA